MNPNLSSKPGVCLGMALARASFGGISYSAIIQPAVLQAAHIQTGKRWRDIPEYNDAPGRTFEEVLTVLEMAG
jgi:hypothetical protein